jgi:hypothetical protein
MPIMPIIDADVAEALRLRHRALVLRQLARRIRSLRALCLTGDAGTLTWVGPTAHGCVDAVRSYRARLLQQADDLAAAATRLETRAGELGR